MRIKICGLSRDADIDYVNEAKPDYAGFVFAESRRKVSPPLAQYLRFRLANDIIPVGVFVNAPIAFIVNLYNNGIISIAQLHGDEDDSYILALKKACGSKPVPVIKTINFTAGEYIKYIHEPANPDFILLDSGAGSGKTFDWNKIKQYKIDKPWFLAGGINTKNLKMAMEQSPYAIDVSSGAETDGIKNREKILQLVNMCRQ